MIRYLTLFLFIGLFSCSRKIKKEDVFIIPEDYLGTVLVIYDVPKSTPANYDSVGRRLFIIPKNGILETTFKATYNNSTMPKFYIINTKFEKVELDYVHNDWDNIKYKDNIVVSTLETGKNKKDFLSFIIGPYNNDTIGNNRHKNRLEYFNKFK